MLEPCGEGERMGWERSCRLCSFTCKMFWGRGRILVWLLLLFSFAHFMERVIEGGRNQN